MLILRLTETAEADLAEIWLEIAGRASEAAASRFLDAIEATFEPIRRFPLAAPTRFSLAAELRVVFHHPYAIYYRPSDDAVTIVRVLHGARDVAAVAAQGGLE